MRVQGVELCSRSCDYFTSLSVRTGIPEDDIWLGVKACCCCYFAEPELCQRLARSSFTGMFSAMLVPRSGCATLKSSTAAVQDVRLGPRRLHACGRTYIQCRLHVHMDVQSSRMAEGAATLAPGLLDRWTSSSESTAHVQQLS
jgi:hypothetical protein